MTEAAGVPARADAWQAALEARDVDGIADSLHAEYALTIVASRPFTMPGEQWLRDADGGSGNGTPPR